MRVLLAALVLMTATLVSAPSMAGFDAYSKQRFEAAVAAGGPVLVHVHADWCPTCHRQIPALDALLQEPAFRDVTAIRVNFDRDREFLRAYRVPSQSVVLVIRNGRETARVIGQTRINALRSGLQAGL